MEKDKSEQHQNFRAFSLIELMVVIAIVAVLAAIAVPAYQNYILSFKASSIVPIIGDLMNKSIIFSATNGNFGSAYDLGLTTSITDYGSPGQDFQSNVDTPLAISPYLTNLRIGDVSNMMGSSTSCGALGQIQGTLNYQLLGFPSDYWPYSITFDCYYWNHEGTIEKKCFYTVPSPGFEYYDSGNWIPGWSNQFTGTPPNTVQSNVFEDFQADLSTIASCQK